MLTYDDLTVPNAYEMFDACKSSKAAFWGFKEEALPVPEMRALFDYMKANGKRTVLEVVAYEPEECMAGALTAAECGVEIMMGTVYSDAVNRFCADRGIKYMPFVGEVSGRPSVLKGTAEGMIAEAQRYLAKGVYGFDLLGYRFEGDMARLNREFVRRVPAPVCIAGSVNSFRRLDEVKQTAPWAFTVGSAFFDKCFGEDFAGQIDTVCDYMRREVDPSVTQPDKKIVASL